MQSLEVHSEGERRCRSELWRRGDQVAWSSASCLEHALSGCHHLPRRVLTSLHPHHLPSTILICSDSKARLPARVRPCSDRPGDEEGALKQNTCDILRDFETPSKSVHTGAQDKAICNSRWTCLAGTGITNTGV